jgi:DNA-binding LacI/PurR family transcriptional regulator
MAAGALQAARRLGRRVPDDLAVVGFDDVPEAAFYTPALTTISQPLTELGGQAVERLLQVMAGKQEEPEEIHFEPIWAQPSLVIRESSIRTA